MKILLITLSLVTSLLMFPVWAEHTARHDTDMTHTAHTHHKIGDLVISNAFVRPTTKAGMSSAGYMTVSNNGDVDDTLVGIHADGVSKIEIHDTKIDDNGVMSMTPITDGIVIPAKQSITFKPRGLHLMLIDVTSPLVRDAQIPITLSFKNSGTQKMNVPIANQVTSESCH